jgi:CheY-like chemotaxis protein/anti-sigma regulatory factor (Ser/Thr protein kinase)
MLHTVYEMLEQRAVQKGLILRFELAPNLYSIVNTDEMKLKQILLNLLTNAIKFTPSGEVILRINCAHNDGQNWLKCEVTDTGIGIEPKNLTRIFEGFFQSDLGRKDQEGSGLGLAISQQFVRLLGGEIHVVSTPGQGTTFYFSIQVEVETNERQSSLLDNGIEIDDLPSLPTLYAVQELTAVRILLAEDNIMNQNVTLKMLTRLGYMADVASNGIEVLKALCHKRYDIILMDMQMPIMDGLTAAIRIHQDWLPDERPIIIALTANVMAQEQNQHISHGIIADYLTKPINMTGLQNVLRQFTEDSVNHDENVLPQKVYQKQA